MKTTIRLPLILGLIAFAGAALGAEVRIEQVTVVSPERAQPLREATVVIREGRIVSIETGPQRPNTAETIVIAGEGLYLTPGLIDSHVHLDEVPGMSSQNEAAHPAIAQAARAQIPRSYLLYGYTTVIDLISSPQRVANFNTAARGVGPDVRFCGAVPVVGGYAASKEYPYMLDPPRQTVEAVIKRIKADGASCVKAFAEDGFGPARNIPMITMADAKKLVREAHAVGLPVFMHANATEMQAFAVEAGADIIAHGMWHWDVPPNGVPARGTVRPAVKKVLDDVIARQIGWQPTLQVLPGERDLADPNYLSDPALLKVYPKSLIDWYGTSEGKWFRDLVVPNLPGVNAKGKSAAEVWDGVRGFYAPFVAQVNNATGYLSNHKGKILFGTDTPSAPSYANPPGLNGLFEMHRLVEAGLTPAQVFRAATLTNAETLKLNREIGTVEVGKRANLLLTREDPTKTVDAYAGIVKVIVGGQVIEPADLIANR